MSFGDLLGQIMQQGLGAGSPAQGRLQNSARNLDQSGGGLGGIFDQLQGALGRAGIDPSVTGGLAGKAQDFLRNNQVGGLSGAQVGGIGALAGAVLGGGGLGGAARGGLMAVLGTLAIGALKRAHAGEGADGDASGEVAATPRQLEALASPDAEKVILTAMISAAKADGQIDQAEMQKIIGRISGDSVTADEKAFVLEQVAAPVDLPALAAQVTTPEQAAQVYAASLLVINADTDAERAYLTELASALGLDAATVEELHQMTGAPAAVA